MPPQGLIPSFLEKYSNEEILTAAKLYEDDLKCMSMSALNSEIMLWRCKWKSSKVIYNNFIAKGVESLIYCLMH